MDTSKPEDVTSPTFGSPILGGNQQDNLEKGDVTTPFLRSTSLGGNQQDNEESSSPSTGVVVGVVAGLVVLIAVVVGLVMYIKRRKRTNVGPVIRNGGKNDIEMESPARTTWHETESSNRSSGTSTGVDYTVKTEDDGLEMQPSTMFLGAGISMYDNDSIDDGVYPLAVSSTGTKDESINNGNGKDHEITPDPMRKQRQINKGSSRPSKTDDKTTVVFDSNAKSFKIKSEDECEPGIIEPHEHVSGRSETDTNEKEKRLTQRTQNGYELAKVIPGEDLSNGKGNTVRIMSSLENSNSDESPQAGNYINVELDQDDMYVNHATLKREIADMTENKNDSSDSKEVAPPKPPRLATVETSMENKTSERKSVRAPLPQPRLSKRVSSNAKEVTEVNPVNTKFNNTGDGFETVRTVDKYVEYDPAASDSDDPDYDQADPVYRVNKEGDETLDFSTVDRRSPPVHVVDKYVDYDPADTDSGDPDYDTADPVYDVPRNYKRTIEDAE